MSQVRLRPLAEDDLTDIWCHIALDSPAVADRFVDFLTSKFEYLATFPNAATACPELGEGLRRHAVRDYLIFYTPDDDGIIIERVLHGARDVGELFNPQ
ncbi:MAG: type II toxin-antitoxin system RelE/ParE family toxin [Pseudomonadota bacterium]